MGEDSGKENVRKQNTEEVFYVPHASGSISDQEGLLVIFNSRVRSGTHISC